MLCLRVTYFHSEFPWHLLHAFAHLRGNHCCSWYSVIQQGKLHIWKSNRRSLGQCLILCLDQCWLLIFFTYIRKTRQKWTQWSLGGFLESISRLYLLKHGSQGMVSLPITEHKYSKLSKMPWWWGPKSNTFGFLKWKATKTCFAENDTLCGKMGWQLSSAFMFNGVRGY